MATIVHNFHPFQAIFGDPSAAPWPQPTARWGSGGSPGFSRMSLDYDASTPQMAFFRFRALGYGSGNLTVDLTWWADTASSGDVVWGAAIAAMTPDSDSTSIGSKSLATEATVTDTCLGTSVGRLMRCSITITSLDSLAANDFVTLRIRRVADSGSDTMTGDASLTDIQVSYSDT